MVYSMTGFGRSKKTNGLIGVTVEMKSVNHRFCEISVRMPRQLLIFEDKIKKVITEYIKRGRVEVFVTVEGEGWTKRKLQVDWQLMSDYYEQIKKASDRFALQDSITLAQLFQLEGVTEVVEEEAENQEIEHLLLSAADEAVVQLKAMRQQEGKALLCDIEEQLAIVRQCVQMVEQLAPEVAEQYRERLMRRIKEFVQGEVEETRLLTEVAIFAEKADINEELKRIRSHIEQFVRTLQHTEPIGRKLDFLVQELNREVNTIGSKANDSRIALQVVEMKSALEKVKEQVQNVE
ncbi:YicC/YloC family endoribonuclease [Anoxybacteroides tepidamans]|uniref:YicC/YloC family endoribonuclease n=1 Tax=Anoxybacteroides tepidamans TaxID=265948 RepID=UPI0004849BD3|nr:YicC/YloC family endoribonuclease [Anoxybacillus tepidamans]